ncbi:YceI family protein [Celeribacter sp.]|uniref:YceI family protein n=1 Tax=Celeribacter sp. TaxID=1890673 RepID=UPI003A8CE5C0
MKTLLLASVAALGLSSAAHAEAVPYVFDASHSQIVFEYNHLGFSNTVGVFSGFDGNIQFDEEDPAASSVEVSFPTDSLYTGWDERTTHFLSGDFFGAEENPTISFVSTSIEVTGENTGVITGDLTLNGITKPVSLDAVLNQKGDHPMAGKAWLGFDATTTVLRSEFDMGMFTPFVADEVAVNISIEAMRAE